MKSDDEDGVGSKDPEGKDILVGFFFCQPRCNKVHNEA
jgi:hypothetical protein